MRNAFCKVRSVKVKNMEIPLLSDILVLLGMGIVVAYISNLVRVPLMVSLLITGVVAGPYGLALIEQAEAVKVIAEIGVILLLFSIGLEFSFEKMLEMKKVTFLGGGLQLIITSIIVVSLLSISQMGLAQCVFISFLVALSSTAIVIKILQQQLQLNAPHGRVALGILIFQDITVVFLMMLVPLLAGLQSSLAFPSGVYLAKLILFAGFLFVCAKWLVPRFLYHVLSTRNRELFLMAIAFLAFFVAWITSELGLSLALGAFIAGLIVSESEYSQGAVANIQPLRDLFMSFFFVSVGMLFDYHILLINPLLVLILLIGLVLIKFFATAIGLTVLGYSSRTVMMASLSLAQIGEFSFVLATLGISYRLLNAEQYQIFLAVTILSMMLTPLLINFSKRLVLLKGKQIVAKNLSDNNLNSGQEISLNDHIIIIGYGINGRNLARVAKSSEIPYIVIDTNPETIRKERQNGENIFFGDAVQKEVLLHAGIKQARILALAVSDPMAEKAIIVEARHVNPNIYIIARTRYVSETPILHRLGADEVIPEEFETSIEIFARVLTRYNISRKRIEDFIAEIRRDNYSLLRGSERDLALKTDIPGLDSVTFTMSDQSKICGQTLEQINVRQNYAVTIIGIIRNGEIIPNPSGAAALQASDQLIVVGERKALHRFQEVLEGMD
ncbi:MAG: cation:proton antiporter [Deltaproteobacteria bacterium]|nr:cation:proton antiporter [Deltaproteobacteria bacterium]